VHSSFLSPGNSEEFETYFGKGERFSSSSHDGWGTSIFHSRGDSGVMNESRSALFNIIANPMSFRLTRFRFWSKSFLRRLVHFSILTSN